MNKWEALLIQLTEYGRKLFISIMVVYLFVCLGALAMEIVSLMEHEALFGFAPLKLILNDALYTLIILAIVKTLYINSGFDYAVTFLEIGFVVILRKLILIDIAPDELGLVVALGLISALFFVLILITNRFRTK